MNPQRVIKVRDIETVSVDGRVFALADAPVRVV